MSAQLPSGQTAVSAGATTGRARGGIGRTPMPLSQLVYYNPNRPDATEAIWQPQYDFQTYLQAGQTSMTFFQVPNGQSSKTLNDTNMQLAGQFPAPTAFLVTAIMVLFEPLNVVSRATNVSGAAAANWVDAVAVANSGFLQLQIGNKIYLTDAPIGKFPPNFTIGGMAAAAGTSTSDKQWEADYARSVGRYYEITPFLIPQSQNFQVTLNWPTAVSVTVAGRIGVILDGFYYRQSQ